MSSDLVSDPHPTPLGPKAPALLEMHSQGRIHGDLKPGSVLVSGLLSTEAAAPPAKQGLVAKMVDLGHSVVCHEGGCPTMGTRGWRAPGMP